MNADRPVIPIHKPSSAREIPKANRGLLAIGGMRCQGCAVRIRNSLLSLKGVRGADVLLNLALAEVLYDGRMVTASQLREAVRRAGNGGRHDYHAEMISNR